MNQAQILAIHVDRHLKDLKAHVQVAWTGLSDHMAASFVGRTWFIQSHAGLTFSNQWAIVVGQGGGSVYTCIETHHPDLRVDNQTEKRMKVQDRVTFIFCTTEAIQSTLCGNKCTPAKRSLEESHTVVRET